MSSETKDQNPESKGHSTFTRTIIDIKDLEKVLKKGVSHGVCGGHNLGNTCFMNSSIACLSNCTELTTYFLTDKYKSDINKKNKEGSGGKLAEAWKNLLDEYWNSSSRAGNPSKVKSIVGKKDSKFSGYGQQDSNEFMTVFLSILNEDLNKTDKKVYKELKEKGEDESELDCAKRFWNLHLQLNNSIITDLFSGLLKSEVQCSNPNCQFKNITFDPFNTLTLAIPSLNKLYQNITRLFYIPKYSIRKNCKLDLTAKKCSSLKDIMIEETKSIRDFKYNLKKLKFIKVLDQELIGFLDENEPIKSTKDFIFVFDDLTKEGEKNNIIPIYLFYKDQISAFPRLLFLEENINFGQLKKKIYYLSRNFFAEPIKGKKEVDEELKNYKGQKENFDEEKLCGLFDKEYSELFQSQTSTEEIDNFLKDFPYKIVIKKKFNEKEEICLFDGKNNLDNLNEFEISKDEDQITNLLDKIINSGYCINLMILDKSSYIAPDIKLDICESYKNDFSPKNDRMNLDVLLTYFNTAEHLDKGNEWKCGKCKTRVEATKKLSIYYVPKLLIICLSRFSKSDRYYGKNGEFIDFPIENLDIGKYICGPDKEHSIYDLFAVSQHYGSTGGGHYTAVCRNIDGKWYGYDDSICSGTSPGSAVTSAAYVLFYRRRTW